MDIGDGNPGARGAKLEAGGWRRTAAAAAWRRAHRTVILKSAMLSAHGQAVCGVSASWRLVGRRPVGSGSEDCGQCRPRLGWCRVRLVRRCRLPFGVVLGNRRVEHPAIQSGFSNTLQLALETCGGSN